MVPWLADPGLGGPGWWTGEIGAWLATYSRALYKGQPQRENSAGLISGPSRRHIFRIARRRDGGDNQTTRLSKLNVSPDPLQGRLIPCMGALPVRGCVLSHVKKKNKHQMVSEQSERGRSCSNYACVVGRAPCARHAVVGYPPKPCRHSWCARLLRLLTPPHDVRFLRLSLLQLDDDVRFLLQD